MEKFVLENEAGVIAKLAEEVDQSAKAAIAENGAFRLGVSGGSLIKYLIQALATIETDWKKWKIFFCDERVVPETDGDSTFGAYKRDLIPKTDLTEEQFVTIDVSLSLEDCAADYERKVLSEFQLDAGSIPQFDLLLLGMGPDGHTCSLFPGHALLKETQKLIAPIDDSPKPPPKRVTMTFPLINNAKCCIFAMAGEGKADMVKRVFLDKEELPAGLVAPKNGTLKGIFDKGAGKFF